MKKKVLSTGQHGSYMAEYLLDLGYEVRGSVRHVALSGLLFYEREMSNKDLI